MASSGEPWTEDAYLWLHHRVGRGALPIINYSGGTEVSGAILSNTVTEPIDPCAFSGPVPGMGAAVVDPAGQPVPHGQGELALMVPSPGMPVGFWGQPGRYEATYWQRWPGTWNHGDWVERTPEDVWYVHGRSDDTLKIAGKRLGPAEVENVVNALEDVVESAAIGVPDALTGSALVIYARVRPGVDADTVAASVSERVAVGLGKPLRPRAVYIVDDLPRTRSGKILRRLVLDAHLRRPVDPSTSSLANPESLASIGGDG
jgi:acetyl-CoA synthetase